MNTTIITAILGSGVLSTLITVVAQLIKDRKDKDADLRAGVRLSLYFQFKDHALAAIREGFVDPDDLKILSDTYETYKRLGGDGYCDKLMRDVNNLNIVQKGAL